MIRVRGGAHAMCKTACREPGACERVILGATYQTCNECDDVQPECPDGVQDAKACEAGCNLEVVTASSRLANARARLAAAVALLSATR